MRELLSAALSHRFRWSAILSLTLCAGLLGVPGRAAAQDQIYFSAVDNVTNVLVQKINAETVRLDISSWYLSEHAISIAIANRFHAGVPVRIIGDRAALFENDVHTKNEFYWLASQGVPIRLRFNPTWFPEINHWKMALFVGQNLVEFGSGNFAPTELAPVSSTNYDDETELFTTDPTLVNAFKTKFDVMWNDTTPEPESLVANPPYLKDWNDACANEPTGGCSDYLTQYPNPAPMVINTARLEGNNPMPVDLIWGQGPDFNNRLTQEINKEQSRVDLVVYRLEVDNITQAILAKFNAGVPVRILVDPAQYTKITWPEYWLTHANIDKLWAAGVPIRQALHDGVTHMKTLVTSTYATNASSNFGPNWQRDHDYFVSATGKPSIYQAIADRVDVMWNDTTGFGPLKLTPPNAATLSSPTTGATGVAGSTSFTWNTAAWAVSYDIYLGTTQANMTKVANVPAQMVVNPPTTYSWKPTTSLQPGTTYFWKVVSLTNASALAPTMIATSSVWSFSTAGTAGPPAAPSVPSPADGSTGVSITPTLGWSSGAAGTTFTIAIGQTNPPPQVATGLSAPSYAPGTLAANTTYYWSVTSVSGGFSTAGAIWSFVTGTGSGGGNADEVVIDASDIPQGNLHGAWSKVSDASAAGSIKLADPDAGAAVVNAPLSAPVDYVDATFQAVGGTRYRVWLRMQATANSKLNDSLYVQFSDSNDSSGHAIYRMGTTGGLLVNLATDAGAASLQGWGWQRNAYWLADTGDVWFQNGGLHTIRLQVREDGVQVDQIVISPLQYVNTAPGPVSNDSTIVPKPSQPPSAPGLPEPTNGASGVATSATLTWSAPGATSYDINFGTTNPPPLVAPGTPAASYAPDAMVAGTQYFWQVVAHNANGSTTGSVWSFTTAPTAPPPPAPPASPSPANGATGVSTSPLLTWSSSGATTYDVRFGTANPPPQISSGQTAASFKPASLTPGVTYFWQIVARNATGATTGSVWSFTAGSAAADVVIYANDAGNTPHGFWSMVADATAANGAKLSTPDNGAPATNNPAATPSDYVDVTFDAQASTPYTFWIRLQALANSKYNDAVWVQFSDASANGAAVYQIGSTNGLLVNLATDASGSSNVGWGWVNGAYWLTQPVTVTFASSGSHTLRVQAREDGVQFDQIVLSPSTYLTAAPGLRTNDSTIVAKPAAPGPPAVPATPAPSNQATGVTTTPTLTWTASGATSYDVSFGTSNPPAPASAGQSAAAYTPAALTNSTTYFWQIVAHNAAGTTTGPVWSFTTAATAPPDTDIVIYAADIPAAGLHGNWSVATDPSSPNNIKLVTPDNGLAFTDAPLATPTHYVDVTFSAVAGTPYRFWMRMQALNNSKYNDSLWVQFSDALVNGSAVYPINSGSGLDVNLAADATGAGLSLWGWQNTAYWLSQPTAITFATSGTHTLRIQVREDGAQFDQIVLSRGQYLNAAPGPLANDHTIVAKP